jgi:hypothetical protein
MGFNATFRMSGREFRLTKSKVEAAMEGVRPEAVASYFVVVKGRRYPPRQVMSEATGLAPKAILSANAERRLRELGFITGRVPERTTPYADSDDRMEGITAAGEKKYYRSGELLKRRYHRSVSKPGSTEAPVSTSHARDTFEAQLRQHVGEWVATRGTDLLFAAPEAKSVITWLTEHGERAESMYKVPEDFSQISGTASA